MTKHSISALSALTIAALGLASTSLAGTHMTSTGKDVKTYKETVKESWITGDIGLDITSQYVFHGIVQENQGVIFQPYADWYFKLYESEGFLNTLTFNLGIWNSFHSHHPNASSTRSWYEFDFLAGLSFVFAKNFTFTPTYVIYSSPNDSFGTSHNLQLRLGYNDTDLLGAFALNPYALVEIELDGKAGNGTDEGVYYEIGITPGHAFGPFNVSLPIKAGFGASDYYAGDDGFGFFSAGVVAAYNLAFIPEKFGAWSVNANATYYKFDDCCDDANAIKNDDSHTWAFGGGVKVAF